jgi:hypothetical protein
MITVMTAQYRCDLQEGSHSGQAKLSKDALNTFSRQLKRLLPLVVALANVRILILSTRFPPTTPFPLYKVLRMSIRRANQ